MAGGSRRAGSLGQRREDAEPLVAELVVDRDRVLFLQEDREDEAKIRQADASTVETYVRAGFRPAAAVSAVRTNNLAVLEAEDAHTGLPSVQVHPDAPNAVTSGTPAGDDPDEGTDE